MRTVYVSVPGCVKQMLALSFGPRFAMLSRFINPRNPRSQAIFWAIESNKMILIGPLRRLIHRTSSPGCNGNLGRIQLVADNDVPYLPGARDLGHGGAIASPAIMKVMGICQFIGPP